MEADEFSKLDSKLNKIHGDVIETKTIVTGHTQRIESCEKDRDDLFGSRNDHEVRLTTIETDRKAKDKYDGMDRRNRTITFDWIMRILMAVFAAATTGFVVLKIYKGS